MSSQASEMVVADIDRSEFQALAERANDGDPTALAKLRSTLAANPAIADKLGNLAAMVEQSLCASISPGSVVTTEVVAAKVRGLRESLLQGSTCDMTRLAVDRVVVGWMMVHVLDLRYPATAKLPPAEASVVIKQKMAAERRYQGALRTLAAVRRLAPALAVPRLGKATKTLPSQRPDLRVVTT